MSKFERSSSFCPHSLWDPLPRTSVPSDALFISFSLVEGCPSNESPHLTVSACTWRSSLFLRNFVSVVVTARDRSNAIQSFQNVVNVVAILAQTDESKL